MNFIKYFVGIRLKKDSLKLYKKYFFLNWMKIFWLKFDESTKSKRHKTNIWNLVKIINLKSDKKYLLELDEIIYMNSMKKDELKFD